MALYTISRWLIVEQEICVRILQPQSERPFLLSV